MQDTRLEVVKYSPTWVEWALTFAGIATFFLFFTLMSKFVTIIPVSEFADKDKAKEKMADKATITESEIVPV